MDEDDGGCEQVVVAAADGTTVLARWTVNDGVTDSGRAVAATTGMVM